MVAKSRKRKPVAAPAVAAPVIRVRLPEKYSARQLVEAAKFFRENPTAIGVVGWMEDEFTAERWFGWFHEKLNEKINARDPRYGNGRKWGAEYTLELNRARYYVGNRIVIDWVAPILGRRVRAAFEGRMRNRDRNDY